eukprot:TRINITY_DN1596_c0_g1_i8.p1 TRINITY_DN1596_c0_g1~~TRINITY_DN1596_c0_g1_i8.p1  ORF type:complete len:510 (+),score=73.17 TRINITY_DN1596_c0_g1_i8:110-1531(+)
MKRLISGAEQVEATCSPLYFNTTSFMVPMRDGVFLYTKVVFPVAGVKPTSVVLERTPYGADLSPIPIAAATNCRIGISQDFRGRYKSQGTFAMWRDAASDGYDVQNWISNQPWSNGIIYIMGASAPCIAAYMEPRYSPPSLKSAYFSVGVPNVYSTLYQQGTYRESLTNGWLTAISEPSFIPIVMSHEGYSSFWNATDMDPYYSNFNFPSVHYSGWYDIFQQHSLDGFHGVRSTNPNTTILVMGPHGHCNDGDVQHPDTVSVAASLFATYAIWDTIDLYKGHLPPNYVVPYALLWFYVMGPGTTGSTGNFFVSMNEWPVYESTSLYLTSNNGLSLEMKDNGQNSSYVYDPNHPVGTIGGANLNIPCGPRDQRPVLNRTDVLYFSTGAMSSDVAITGRMRADLYVSSNCTDTDFMVKLMDVYPDGRVILLTDNAIRMRWRNNNTQSGLMVPGTVYNVSIDLTTTSYVVNKDEDP